MKGIFHVVTEWGRAGKATKETQAVVVLQNPYNKTRGFCRLSRQQSSSPAENPDSVNPGPTEAAPESSYAKLCTRKGASVKQSPNKTEGQSLNRPADTGPGLEQQTRNWAWASSGRGAGGCSVIPLYWGFQSCLGSALLFLTRGYHSNLWLL